MATVEQGVIEFDAGDSVHGHQVSIVPMSGEPLEVKVGPDVTMNQLKVAVAEKKRIEECDFYLIPVGQHSLPVGTALVSSVAEGDVTIMCMARHRTLEKYESEAGKAWQQLAATLQNQDVDDATALVSLRSFLDSYPSLINFQARYADAKDFKPLLSFAIEGVRDISLRQQCVDTLLSSGARVHIRHSHGFLVDEAEKSGSAFFEYLKSKKDEHEQYEAEAIAAWRNVSSKLCGETSTPVYDEGEMTKIVTDFCQQYPAMVNFQNNHACDASDDRPYGYFGYAPLLAFAGGRACRERRGHEGESEISRLTAFQALLRHGARVDVEHGGKNVLEWMKSEGSHIAEWLECQFKLPMPEHVPFEFTKESK
mmetsp:Transcript_23595/g.42635  ORF Transcript_23595/g.42635 Transcript_23595/m.42635 type:complete len:367 (-) Transcript_23595:251-1351(-)|eukprot:CAMPEP_0197661396 /NCGR_PEP_ID=MMETSP1338-20131121/51430_1 /TAXON_ID=43686 ORGANISM="Pelagodinium beii, Strain RCC1491" /NCGR_SAMPLE_ID=MMETSP1338 /ASSEMBLY_ACC=CAM_ASM_000754 /LENGTH=366 /DNA_ID=CAMNT_0043238945 /DNA_START=124 /DNA_END=1224 /DNA_ORIENTATION=+